MENQSNENKLFMGVVISGLVAAAGVAVAYGLHSANSHRRPLKKIGKTISEIGEMIGNCDLGKEASAVVETVEQKVTGSDVFNHLTTWLDTGLTLWKKFKKG